MEVDFGDDDLASLEIDPTFTAGFGREIVRAYRKAMQSIRAAIDSRDLYNGGLRTEKLKGRRKHEHSIRLNDQWRLIVEINGKRIRIKKIEDYH